MTFFGVSLDGKSISMQRRNKVENAIRQRYEDATVTVQDVNVTYTFEQVGIKPDVSATADRLLEYPMWQRLIPFSGIYHALKNRQVTTTTYDDGAVRQWSASVASRCKRDPLESKVEIKADGTFEASASRAGRSCDEAVVYQQLKNAPVRDRMTIDVRPAAVPETHSQQSVQAVIDTAHSIAQNGVQVRVLDKNVAADAETVRSWLAFGDSSDGRLVASVDAAKLKDYLDRVQQLVYVAPGTTNITVTDGVETSRTVGSPGRTINRAKLQADIQKVFSEHGSNDIRAEVVSIAARETYMRNFSNNTEGLQSLLNQLVRDKGNVSISLIEIGGQGRNLNANGSRQYHPASTYKLAVAYSVIRRIENGQMQWSNTINGTTVEDCMAKMIINSDEPCAMSLARYVSWSAVTNEARSIGMSSTNYASNFVSTTNDQALFLYKLETGQLMNNDNKAKLIEWMKRQKFRAGVPAGTGHVTADKVGFYSGNIHDSAIVYSPRGAYVLVVYTSGSNWASIADIARQIQATLDR